MNRKLEYHFDRLEQIKTEILSKISDLTDKDLELSAVGKWSLAQVLMHIITSEQLALNYMRKKSLGIDQLEKSGALEPLKLLLLKISQRLPIKYKAPKVIVEKTPTFPNKTEMVNIWDGDRRQLKLFLSGIAERDIDKKVFKHPIAGMFNAAQGLDFLREHIIHHKPQINRLLSRIKSK